MMGWLQRLADAILWRVPDKVSRVDIAVDRLDIVRSEVGVSSVRVCLPALAMGERVRKPRATASAATRAKTG